MTTPTRNGQWTDADKAWWILENSWTPEQMLKIFTRVGDWVYAEPAGVVPPWIPKVRTLEYQIGG